MKKLMFAAFAAATVAGTAFAAAAPEPKNKAYNLTVTTKQIQTLQTQMTKKNISTNDLEQAWKDAEAAAPLDYEGNRNFYPDASEREQLRKDGMLGYYETTNKNSTVTIKWQQYKPAKNGTNIVAATKVMTTKANLIVFMDKDNNQIRVVTYSTAPRSLGFKYWGSFVDRYSINSVTIMGDGKAKGVLRGPEEAWLAGHGKAAKSNTSDKSGPYDYVKSFAGNYADETGVYGTWKLAYDKKLSKALKDVMGERDEDEAANDADIAEALLAAKKIKLMD